MKAMATMMTAKTVLTVSLTTLEQEQFGKSLEGVGQALA